MKNIGNLPDFTESAIFLKPVSNSLFMFNYRELYSATVVLALPHGHVVRVVLPDDVTHLPIVFEGTELEIKFSIISPISCVGMNISSS